MNSDLTKWRCLIALAHADNRVVAEEQVLIEKKIAAIPFTRVERKILEDDLLQAHPPMPFFEALGQDDRREVIQLAFALFWADGEFHAAEREFFKILRKKL